MTNRDIRFVIAAILAHIAFEPFAANTRLNKFLLIVLTALPGPIRTLAFSSAAAETAFAILRFPHHAIALANLNLLILRALRHAFDTKGNTCIFIAVFAFIAREYLAPPLTIVATRISPPRFVCFITSYV
jgi:hypothetical protein